MRRVKLIFAASIALLYPVAAQEVSIEDSLGFIGDNWEHYLERFDVKDIKTAAELNVDEIIRLYWVPTFGNPTLYEAVRKADQWTMACKTLTGKGGYSWGELKSQASVELTSAEGQKLKSLCTDSVWAELSELELGLMSQITDGERWRLEQWTPKLHRVTFLRSPECLASHIHPGKVRNPMMFTDLLDFMRARFRSLQK